MPLWTFQSVVVVDKIWIAKQFTKTIGVVFSKESTPCTTTMFVDYLAIYVSASLNEYSTCGIAGD